MIKDIIVFLVLMHTTTVQGLSNILFSGYIIENVYIEQRRRPKKKVNKQKFADMMKRLT